MSDDFAMVQAGASATLALGHPTQINPNAGLVAHANQGARVIVEMTGINMGGTIPVVTLGFDPGEVEAFADELRRVAQTAREQERHWKTCSECRGQVRHGEQSWPECAQDCAE